MTIEQMKKEMGNWGINQNQINDALEIIYFIGVGQDLAWREGEGVIRKDISIDKPLLNYLKQGYIIEDSSRYEGYPVYKLGHAGEKVFQEIIEIKKKPDVEGFEKEFRNIGPKIFSILSSPIHQLDISERCEVLFSNSKKGGKLKKTFNDKKNSLNRLLEKYNFYISLTKFQSKRRDFSKSKFINNREVSQLLLKYAESFPFLDSIDELHNKISFFDDLINSIKNPEIRRKLGEEYSTYFNDCKEIIEKLHKEKITTAFNSSESYCFKIINEQGFKNRIEKTKQEYIDKISDPIIDDILSEEPIAKEIKSSVKLPSKPEEGLKNEKLRLKPTPERLIVDNDEKIISSTSLQKELIKCFEDQPPEKSISIDYLKLLEEKLKEIINEFNIECEVNHENFEKGPRLIRADLKPKRGMRYEDITKYSQDIANRLFKEKELFSFATETDIPKYVEIENVTSKGMFGIYLPRKEFNPIRIKDILLKFPSKNTLNFSIGKNIVGQNVYSDLEQMPHLLVAGATNSGKSVFINSMLVGLIFQNEPTNLNLILIDPKGGLELASYENIKHLYNNHIYIELEESIQILKEINQKMEHRYELFRERKVRKLSDYNRKYPRDKLQYFSIVIDEFANLVQKKGGEKLSTLIQKIAEKGRGAGIHLVISTQRPSVKVISGDIKANIPGRLSFRLSSSQDSRVILDENGAEKLFGRGDLLLIDPERSLKVRCQGAYVTDDEIDKFISKIKEYYK